MPEAAITGNIGHVTESIRRVSGAGAHLNIRERGGLIWLSAPNLDAEADWALHGFSTRLGGVSTGEIGTMNLSFLREEEAHVRENYRRLGEAVGFEPERLVLTHQTHSVRVACVSEAEAGSGYLPGLSAVEADGLVTAHPGLTLACFGSDCVMLLAADPIRRCVGCAHSGWRGSLGDIGGELIRTMTGLAGSRPEDIRTVIGPSICMDCFEVGGEVAEQFAARYAPGFHDQLFYRKENGKYQLSLWRACALNFELAGVRPEHMMVTDLSTKCNPYLLYSHRRQKGRQTNLAALIGIR